MAADEILDLQKMLDPIVGENPAGKDVLYTAHDLIKTARREYANGKPGDRQQLIRVANEIIKKANEILAYEGKDLTVAIWLTEALIKVHGFAALPYGFRMLTELQSRFGDRLYPVIEQGNLEFRLGVLSWLTANVPSWIRGVPLTVGDEYDCWQWRAALEGNGGLTVAIFDKAVASTPREFYEAALDDLNLAKKELERLEQIVDETFGAAAPSFSNVKETIEEIETFVGGFLKRKGEPKLSDRTRTKPSGLRALFNKFLGGDSGANLETEEDNGQGLAVRRETSVMEVAAQRNQVVSSGKNARSAFDEPASREEAFQRLEMIATYLKRIEPHSPVSYLIERAIRWGGMPLDSWLNEVIQNEDFLKRLRDTLGIQEKKAT